MSKASARRRSAGQPGAATDRRAESGGGRRAGARRPQQRGGLLGGGIPGGNWTVAGVIALIVVVAVVVVVTAGSSKSGHANVSFTGGGYPNGDLANTRSSGGPINSGNVSKLSVAWTLPLSSSSTYGSYASTPVIANGVVYSQDLSSNVQAIDLKTGEVLWSREFNSEDNGPNGLVVANGEVFGATATAAFALDQKTGQQLWSVTLPENEHESIDMSPGYHEGDVYVSTVPAQLSENNGGGIGVLWALDAKTGKKLWHFDTAPEDLWSPENKSINAGGGVWYSPAFDEHGGMYVGTANPVPLPGTNELPWGASRPGPDLYTDSLVKLNAKTGKLQWYYQATPHDLYDWDFQDPPILAQVKGRQVVLGAGKSGVVAALDASSGKLLWRRDVGIHNGHDNDGIYAMKHEYSKLSLPETIYPGELGGVIAQMASDGSTVYAPVVNMPATFSAQSGHPNEGPSASGELVALDIATGQVKWTHKFPSPAFGAATVVNDVVFVSTADGELYAINKSNGAVLWENALPAGSISGVAVSGEMLLIGAGKASSGQKPELVAYKGG